jgi:hypothetical protein
MAGSGAWGELDGRRVVAQKVGAQKVCMHGRESVTTAHFPVFRADPDVGIAVALGGIRRPAGRKQPGSHHLPVTT